MMHIKAPIERPDESLVVALESQPDEATQIVLLSGMAAYNESRAGPDPVRQPENHICIVARDGDNRVISALSVSSPADRLTREAAIELAPRIIETAEAISRQRGWLGESSYHGSNASRAGAAYSGSRRSTAKRRRVAGP